MTGTRRADTTLSCAIDPTEYTKISKSRPTRLPVWVTLTSVNTNEQTPDNTAAQEAVREAVELTRQAKVSEAIPVFEEHLSVLAEGTINDRRSAAASFSYYGLCVARVRRKYAESVKYCEISIRANPLDPEHRANLAMVYLERNDRARAVETLNSGLRLDRKNRRINSILDLIGRRRPPVIRFLSRDNPLNIWLGKRRSESSEH